MNEVVTMRFTVEFYEKENGEIPVINFIDSLEPKLGAKVLSLIEILICNDLLSSVNHRKSPQTFI